MEVTGREVVRTQEELEGSRDNCSWGAASVKVWAEGLAGQPPEQGPG